MLRRLRTDNRWRSKPENGKQNSPINARHIRPLKDACRLRFQQPVAPFENLFLWKLANTLNFAFTQVRCLRGVERRRDLRCNGISPQKTGLFSGRSSSNRMERYNVRYPSMLPARSRGLNSRGDIWL